MYNSYKTLHKTDPVLLGDFNNFYVALIFL